MSVLLVNTVLHRPTQLRLLWVLALVLASLVVLSAQSAEELARHLRNLEPSVLSGQRKRQAVGLIQRDIQRRRSRANAPNLAEWKAIKGREHWEAYRDERLQRLKMSLGKFPSRQELSCPFRLATTRVAET
jgi:hypothetical protein